MTRINIIKGDITALDVDAIVNAANTSLLGGGGVDGAIHRAGGPQILEACKAIRNKQGGCKTGEAVITTGGNLKAKYVIHTVGPVWNGGLGNEDVLLESCYRNSMRIAIEHQLKSIAFPNISTGIYGYPKDRAAMIAIRVIKEISAVAEDVAEIIFCCFDEDNFRLYQSHLSK